MSGADAPAVSPPLPLPAQHEGRHPSFPYVIAMAAALLAAVAVGWDRFSSPVGSLDVDQFWHAGGALLAGEDPYRVIGPDLNRRFPWPYYYPLTAAVLFTPLAFFPIHIARIVFVCAGASVFGYAIALKRPHAWPSIVSAPFLIAAVTTQMSPLLTAAMVVPALGFLAATKPNVGLVLLAQCRSRRQVMLAAIGGLVLLAVSLVVDPGWPATWLETVRAADHFRPLVFRPGGWLALLALLRWRDPDARLLAALAVVPQTGMWYEALPVFLTVGSRAQALILVALSHVVFVYSGWYVPATDFAGQGWPVGTLVVWGILLPAVAMVLLRKKAV